MLRVCGVTYDHTTNYGSCLQSYALQKAVEKVEIDGEYCSYELIPVLAACDYPLYKGKTGMRKIKLKAYDLWAYIFHKSQFSRFYKEYIKHTNTKRITDVVKLNMDHDAFVCGSDVIWNSSFNNKLGVFFLDFAEKYAFSYAASVGKAEITAEDETLFKLYLPQLDAISVREESTARVAREYVDKPVKVVADPVLLLTTDEWDSILDNKTEKEKYIFAYATHLSESYVNFLKRLSKETGLKVICAAWSAKAVLKQAILFKQSPQKWLRQLRNAEYVVTNSFHATVFATLYHKKFFTVVKGKKDETVNVRMNDFLNRVGLEDRILSEVPETIDTSIPDFSFADNCIEEMRQESMEFLQANLEAAYQQKIDLDNKEKN